MSLLDIAKNILPVKMIMNIYPYMKIILKILDIKILMFWRLELKGGTV